MFSFKKKKSKKISISKILSVLGNAWVKIFPLVVILLILAALVIIFNIGYSALYKSDLSDTELSSRVVIERKKNNFQKQEFDDIIKNIETRKTEFNKNISLINDIFFTSDILERLNESKLKK